MCCHILPHVLRTLTLRSMPDIVQVSACAVLPPQLAIHSIRWMLCICHNISSRSLAATVENVQAVSGHFQMAQLSVRIILNVFFLRKCVLCLFFRVSFLLLLCCSRLLDKQTTGIAWNGVPCSPRVPSLRPSATTTQKIRIPWKRMLGSVPANFP